MASTPASTATSSTHGDGATARSNPAPIARVYRPRNHYSRTSSAAGDPATKPKRNNTRYPRAAREWTREPPPHTVDTESANEKEEIETTSTTGTSTTLPDADDDCEVCLTCCEPIIIHSIGPCNHNNICNICCLRRRELYKDDQCWCKTKLPQVVFTHDPAKLFANFDLTKMETSPQLQGIYFEGVEDRKAALKLWECSCTVCHSAGFRTVNQLKRHLQEEHRLYFCAVCLEHRAAFAHEQPLFTKNELQRHLQGDKNSDDAHQRCEFCNRSFYNKEHLYKHLTEKHESCHICQQQGILFQYFKDYADLERHFDREHFMCHEEECLEKKFVVFRTALDLHAHDVATHLAHRNLSKDKKREAAKLTLDLVFSDSPSRGAPRPGEPSASGAPSPRRGGRGGVRGGGRGGRNPRNREHDHHSSGSDEDVPADTVELPTAPRTPNIEDAQSFPTLSGGESSSAGGQGGGPSAGAAPAPRRYAGPLRTEWGGRGGGSSGGGQELWPSLPAGGPKNRGGGNKKKTGGDGANWARSVASSSSSSSSSSSAVPPNFSDDPFSWLPPPPRAEHYGGNFSHQTTAVRPLLGVWGPGSQASAAPPPGGNKKKGKQVLFRAG